MKRTVFVVLSVVATVAALGVATVSSTKSLSIKPKKETYEVASKSTTQQSAARQEHVDPPGTINGALNPELISDKVAYSMLFRLVADRPTQEEQNSIRSYLRQAGLGCQTCGATPTGAEEAEIEAIIAAAEEFHRRVSLLDNQADEIKNRTWPNPSAEVMMQLRQLDAQYEAIVTETIASLPARLGASGIRKLQRHVSEGMKRKIKVSPGPSTPPGGPEWQYPLPNHQH